ncbi:MAG: hypothetical protein P1Q69_11200 [Candidatus Thorarchaeota archaeon]|nr:hypothetical protein [Candidatus Thorarchaeota archaeon]
MSQEKTNFGTIIDDMKASFKLASNNVLSYFLAHLGMIVFLVLMLAIVAVPIVAIVFAVGPTAIADWGASLATWSTANLWAAGISAVILIMLPLMALLFMVYGSIFGMTKEIVEKGTSSAESAFSWLRHNFITFAGTGVIMSLIVVVPQLAVAAAVSYFSGYVVTGLTSVGLSIFIFAYSFITLGLTSMVMPAVVNGKGIQDAVVGSFKLAIERFDRIFGLLTAIVLLGLLSFAPILIGAAATALGASITLVGPWLAAGALWAVVAALLWLLLFLPMTIIAFTRVYHDLTGGEVYDSAAHLSEIAMV